MSLFFHNKFVCFATIPWDRTRDIVAWELYYRSKNQVEAEAEAKAAVAEEESHVVTLYDPEILTGSNGVMYYHQSLADN